MNKATNAGILLHKNMVIGHSSHRGCTVFDQKAESDQPKMANRQEAVKDSLTLAGWSEAPLEKMKENKEVSSDCQESS